MKKNQSNDLKNKEKNEFANEDQSYKKENKVDLSQPENQEASDASERLKEELASKEEKLKEYEKLAEENKDRYLRLQADFDNYRKRVAREREDIFAAAAEEIVAQLLPVIDNFDRALESFRAGDLDKKYVEGLEMIYNNFLDTLSKNGLKEIEAMNCTFDPNLHHAVMQIEAGEEDENQIKGIFQKGYMLKNKVIRPSMVKVAIKN